MHFFLKSNIFSRTYKQFLAILTGAATIISLYQFFPLKYFIMGTLTVFVVILVFFYLAKTKEELSQLKERIQLLEKKIKVPFLNDISVNALIGHLNFSNNMNPFDLDTVELDIFQYYVIIDGQGLYKDSKVDCNISGKVVSSNGRKGFNISISGDYYLKFSELDMVAYECISDPHKEKPIYPQICKNGRDSHNKDLLIPFPFPGKKSGESFSINFNYIWPNTFHPFKDYVFLDNIYSFKTKKIKLTVNIKGSVKKVEAFSYDFSKNDTDFLGIITKDLNDNYTLEVDSPSPNTFFILAYELENKEHIIQNLGQ